MTHKQIVAVPRRARDWLAWADAARRSGALVTAMLLAACGGGGGYQEPEAGILVVYGSAPEHDGPVRTDAVLQVHFSEPLDASTATTEHVQLSTEGQAVPATVRVEGDMLYVTPATRLRLKTTYRLTITPGLKSLEGMGLYQPHEILMHTPRAVFLAENIVPATDVASGADPNPMMVFTDVDADGRRDLVLVSRLVTYSDGMAEEGYILQTYRQGMNGKFTRIDRMDVRLGEQLQDVEYPAFLALDVDQDGSDEVVMAEYQMREDAADVANWPVTGLRIFKRQPGGGWRQWQYLRTAYVESVRLGDVDGDGHPDLVGTRTFDADGRIYGYRDSGFQVMLSRPGGLQPMPPVIGLQTAGLAVALTDADRDGDLDLLLLRRPSLEVFANDGRGAFALDSLRTALMPPLFPSYYQPPVVSDLNGDGWPDFVAQGHPFDRWLSDAQGGYVLSPPQQLPTGGGVLIPGAGDIDNDGRPDLFWLGGSPLGGVGFMPWFGAPDGRLESSPPDALSGNCCSIHDDDKRLIDLNGDGHIDVLLANRNAGVLMLRQLPD